MPNKHNYHFINCCDCYKHIDKQGIIALVFGDNDKEANKDEIDVSKRFKCSFCQAEAM